MARDYRLQFREDRLNAILHDADEDALRAALRWLLLKSMPLVPLDMRPDRDQVVLRKTGRIVIDRGVGAVVYGDEHTPYARYQHEDLTLHHPVPGTQAKFLEEPFSQGKDTMLLIMATVIRRRLTGR